MTAPQLILINNHNMTTDKETATVNIERNPKIQLDDVHWKIRVAHGAIEAVRSLTLSQLPDGAHGDDLSVLNRCHLENLLGLINRQLEDAMRTAEG